MILLLLAAAYLLGSLSGSLLLGNLAAATPVVPTRCARRA
jgi:glycerol-3-phosphate acyltransferase PlsY